MSGIPPLANDDDIAIVLCACRKRQAFVSRAGGRITERYLLQVWHSTFAHLQEAVANHVENKRRVYRKLADHGRQIGMHANVTLYDGLDIYVEMQIVRGQVVILAAHNHYTTPLPQ